MAGPRRRNRLTDVSVVAGFNVSDIALLVLYGLGAGLLVQSILRRGIASSDRRVRLLVVALGVATILSAWAISPVATNHLLSRLPRQALAAPVGAFIASLAIGWVDIIFNRVGPRLTTGVVRLFSLQPSRPRRDRLNFVAGLVLFAVVAAALAMFSRDTLSSPTAAAAPVSPTGRAVTLATLELPGSPMALAMRGATDGYVALSSGEILSVRLAKNPYALRWKRLATGLGQVRGIAILDDRLFVTEIVSWPCEDPPARGPALQHCTRTSFDLEDNAAEARIIAGSQGRISRFDIRRDGTLGPRRTAIDNLPVVSSVHAPNGITAGPDGRLYAVIGNVDGLWDDPDVLGTVDRPNLDLLGTIIRFGVDDTEPEIFASGIRNIYGLTFGSGGRLFGVDNDGPTRTGYRGEEVLYIERGKKYGYPNEGSAAPFTERDQGPLWILDAVGSAGIEWAPRAGLKPGLIVGSLERLVYVPLAPRGAGVEVTAKPQTLESASEFRAIVASVGNGLLLVGGPGPLRLVELRA